MGTFERAYALQEGVSTLMPSYINHVHNDWAEVFFEAGAAGVALMALGLIIVGRMSYQAVVCPPGLAGRLLAGGVLGIWLLLAHSLWDYPLRTQACLAVLALALALGVPATEANVMSLEQAWPWARRRKSGRSKSRGDTSGGDTSGGDPSGERVPPGSGSPAAPGGAPAV
jgi:O-antigen ligase